MFRKKKCVKCKGKINEKYEFCPHCGKPTGKSENWGLLGKEDTIDEFEQFSNSLFGGGILGKMFGRTMKMLEKELQKELKNSNNFQKTNFELIINGKRVDPKNIQVSQQLVQKTPEVKIPKRSFSDGNLKRISKLPKKEPLTNIRRLSDRVIYEINMPDVKSMRDISIAKLENSIEIKAVAEDKAYFKVIPINLPIINYKFLDEKLVLELGIRN